MGLSTSHTWLEGILCLFWICSILGSLPTFCGQCCMEQFYRWCSDVMYMLSHLWVHNQFLRIGICPIFPMSIACLFCCFVSRDPSGLFQILGFLLKCLRGVCSRVLWLFCPYMCLVLHSNLPLWWLGPLDQLKFLVGWRRRGHLSLMVHKWSTLEILCFGVSFSSQWFALGQYRWKLGWEISCTVSLCPFYQLWYLG